MIWESNSISSKSIQSRISPWLYRSYRWSDWWFVRWEGGRERRHRQGTDENKHAERVWCRMRGQTLRQSVASARSSREEMRSGKSFSLRQVIFRVRVEISRSVVSTNEYKASTIARYFLIIRRISLGTSSRFSCWPLEMFIFTPIRSMIHSCISMLVIAGWENNEREASLRERLTCPCGIFPFVFSTLSEWIPFHRQFIRQRVKKKKQFPWRETRHDCMSDKMKE